MTFDQRERPKRVLHEITNDVEQHNDSNNENKQTIKRTSKTS